jgi:hypothetical protein
MSVDELVQKGLDLLIKTPTPDGFLRLAVSLAQEVNAIQALSGSEKKAVVLDILKQAIQKSTLSNDQKAELSGLLKTVVPATLDIAVSVARGGFSLQKPKVGCFAALCRMVLAVAPIDPKLKEMASSGLNKAEELATAIEGGKPVSAVKEAVAAVSENPAVVSAVAEAVAEVKKQAEVAVAEVKNQAEATVAAVGSSVSQSVDADPSIGILIISVAPPPPSPSTPPTPPTDEKAQVDEKAEKTADVPNWGESK